MKSSVIFVKERIQYLWEAVLDYIYPDVCFQCKKRTERQAVLVCDSCWAKLKRNTGHTLASGYKNPSGTKQFSFLAWRFGAEMAAKVEQFPGTLECGFPLFSRTASSCQ